RASDAVGAKVTTAPAGLVASTVMFAGRLSTGGVLSIRIVPKLPGALFPALSVAVPFAVEVPSALYGISAGQVATPEVRSPQVKWTVTFCLVHVPATYVAL